MSRERFIDAEEAVIGAIMLDARAYWRVADIVGAEDFAVGKNRRLFDVLAEQVREGGEPDCVTIGELHPDLATAAMDIASATPSAANVVAYAEIVARAAMERRVIQAGQRIAKLSGPDAYAEARTILDACQPRSVRFVVTLKQAMRDWFANVSEKAEAAADTDLTGLPTSLGWLDEQTGGWQPGDLVVIAARPSVGKTLLALQVALHAGQQGYRCLMFSAEMSAQQIADRAVSALGKVSTHALRKPKTMDDEHWACVSRGVALGASLPILVDDSNGITALDIAARAQQLHAERPLSMIVIDYLGLMRHPKADRHDLAIGQTTAALKALAKRLQIPVVLLVQINRDAANSRPAMNNLRDSGSIEQDCDIAIFLHRPDAEMKSQLELIVGKHRNGPTGSMWIYADYENMRFLPGEPPILDKPSGKQRRGYAGKGRDRAQGERE